MRLAVSSQVAAAAMGRSAVTVCADYAPLVRREEQRRRRREVAWAMVSFVALLLCWDLAARLDRLSFGADIAVFDVRTR